MYQSSTGILSVLEVELSAYIVITSDSYPHMGSRPQCYTLSSSHKSAFVSFLGIIP